MTPGDAKGDAFSSLASVERLLERGEGQFVEFKSAWEHVPGKVSPAKAAKLALDVAEALVAMANADGGVVLVGVEDDGRVTGVPHRGDRLAVVRNAPATHCDPPVRATVHEVSWQGQFILVFEADPSAVVHRLTDGRYLYRLGAQNAPPACREDTGPQAGEASNHI